MKTYHWMVIVGFLMPIWSPGVGGLVGGLSSFLIAGILYIFDDKKEK